MLTRIAFVVATLASGVVAQEATAPTFTPSTVEGHFVEQFTTPSVEDSRWSPSRATKDEVLGEVFSYVGEWNIEEASVYPGLVGDKGLVIKSKAAHHAISVPFDTPLDNKGKTLVVQYEVKLQKGLECGGAYIKLLTDSDVGIQAEEFSDKTPYTIMFGPDRCGATSKVHFIFRHTNPVSGEVEEKHLVAPPPPKITKTTALYTLIVRPDQTFEIKVNNLSVKSGSLLEDFEPAVNPSKEIDDPTDEKPEDWVEDPKITDPEAVKPAEWDEDAPQTIEDSEAVQPEDWLVEESAQIPDPDAIKPEEWSDEDDGDWIAPSVQNPKCVSSGCGPWKAENVANPAYKGTWYAPMIDNPLYKGIWAPAKIANPNYFEDKTPANFNNMAGIGIELWSMTEDILFSNIYIGHSEEDAAIFAAETFLIKEPIELAAEVADKPAPLKADNGEEPDMMIEPLAYAQFKFQEFIDVAVIDPIEAIKTLPKTAGAAGIAFASLIGLIGVFASLFIPGPKVKVVKKKAAVVAPVEKKEVAPVTEIDEKKEVTGVRTRASKAADL